MAKNRTETLVDENKVTYKRYLEAPIDLVFESWSSPEHLAQWWGPDGFTLTTNAMNFSNGGIWDFVMHGPDGQDYKNKIQFLEIKKPYFISYKHAGDGEGDADVDFESRIFFESAEEGTNLTMEQIFPSREELERVNRKYGAIEGGKQHLGHLEKHLKASR